MTARVLLKCLVGYQEAAVRRLTHPYQAEIGSLLYWRACILLTILGGSLLLGLIVIVPSLIVAVKENAWGLAVFDVLCYLAGLYVLFSRRLRYEVRASMTLMGFYAIGIMVLVSVGPLSGGSAWLFAFSVLVGVLLGPKPAMHAVLLNAASLLMIAWLILTGVIGAGFPLFSTTEAMVAAGANFLLLNAIAAMSVAVLVKGLSTTYEKERALANSLSEEQMRIVGAKKKLEWEITERKLAEKALAESEAKYRHLFEMASDAILVVEKETEKILEANTSAVELYGYGRNELLAMTHEDLLLGPADVPESFPVFPPLTPVQYHRAKDNREIPVEFSTRPLVWGGKAASINAFRDITFRVSAEKERAKLEKELRQAQKMEAIGALAGGIAHDFNNILSSIIGFTQLALDDVGRNSRSDDCLNEVLVAGKRAVDLVKQILTFARQTDDTLLPIQVGPIAKESLKLLRASIPATISMKSNINSDAWVMGNSTQLNQIFLNLCTNAAHAMDESGGEITVDIEDYCANSDLGRRTQDLIPGEYLRIKVSDTGVGIQPEHLNSIFEPYFTTKEVDKGTGMGLAMVYGIVQKCGGRIEVDSKPNIGTVFSIYIPTTQEDSPVHFDSLTAPPTGTETILFIDDEEPIAKMVRQLLVDLGYRVTTRTSSIEALKLFKARPDDFDLVISDMTMPNMTGDVLARALIAIRPDIPIIICSGYSDPARLKSAENIGVRAFTQKPLIRAKLASVIRQVLDDTGGNATGPRYLATREGNHLYEKESK